MKYILSLFLFSISLSFVSQSFAKEIFVVHQEDTLWGSMQTPQKSIDTSKTVLLIIAGSGPTDRDGNNSIMKNNSLKFLAEDLSKMGYQSLRYDKRGVGKSRNAFIQEEDLVFNQNVLDAELFYDYLLDLGYSKIVIAGHSEGAAIGILLANKRNAYKYISLAGAGRPIQDVLKEQYGSTAPIVRDSAYSIIDSLAKGVKVDTLSPWLFSVFRPQLQDYIISWMQINPATEIAKYNNPCLIVQGTTDMQVKVKDAENLSAANPSAKLVIIADMNHIFKQVSNDKAANKATYTDPNIPLHTDLVFEIVSFLKNK